MIQFRMTAHLAEDRMPVVTLPPETPTGPVEIVMSVETKVELEIRERLGRTSLANWAEAEAEDWDDRIDSTDVEGFTGRRF